MKKKSTKEFVNSIKESLNKKPVDIINEFQIKSYVNDLFESGQSNPRLMSFLGEYNKVLESGETKEFMIFEQFGQGLASYTSGNKQVKNIIKKMNETLAQYGRELNTYKLIECIQDPDAKCAVEDAYTNYLQLNDESSRDILIDAVDMLDQTGDPVAPQLTIIITSPDIQAQAQQIQPVAVQSSKFGEIQRKIEEDKQRRQIEKAKAEIDAYAKEVFSAKEEAERAEREACCYDNVVNNNGICLKESIKSIINSDAKTNKKLMETLEQYKGALNQGLYEERLFEGFIKNITPFNYLKSVEKEIKRLNKVAEDREPSITITKILEEMYTTNSYYIIPLIEEDVCRFIKNPTAVNRNQLKAALVAHAADPYCGAMLEYLEYDNSNSFLINDVAISIKDRANIIKEHANISNIYSPIQYIKENECVFNANGQFYVKKGNTLAKLSEEYIPQLSENFISLCQLVNDPHVAINKDSITLVGNDKVATIYEGYVDINGNRETTKTLRDLNEMSMKYDFDTNFFIMASCLHENFNNIADINFAKHIALNADEGTNVDIFNLNGNIFVNAMNESMIKSTFYHNVNPIQCRNLINSHMGINVATLFEDLIPSQEKLYLKLNETKEEYEASIEKYESTIEKLKKAKEEGVSEESGKKLDAAIEAAETKVEELKKEYKEWQDDVDKVTKPESKKAKDNDEEDFEDDPNTKIEKSNEPIDIEDVDDDVKNDLSAPLSGNRNMDLSLTDDEFDNYLEGKTEIPADAESMDDTEVNMTHHALSGDGQENEDPDQNKLVKKLNNEEDPIDADDLDIIGDDMTDMEDDMTNMEDDMTDMEDDMTDMEDDVEGDIEDQIDFEDEYYEDEVEEINNKTEESEGVALPEGYKISSITFDQNLKTGELFRTGTLVLVTDMISEDGRMYTETESYKFYIDEETHLPIIEVADIPVALYNAMVSSIQTEEEFVKFDSNGKGDKQYMNNQDKSEEIYYDADDVNAVSDELEQDDDEGYFDFSDDGEGEVIISAKDNETIDIEDDEEEIIKPNTPIKASSLFANLSDEDEDDEEGVITPAYKSGNTVIDKPADNIDFDDDDDDFDFPEFDDEDDDFDFSELDDEDEDDIKNVKTKMPKSFDDEDDDDDIIDDEFLESLLTEENEPQQQQAQNGQQPAQNGQQPQQQPAQNGQQPAQNGQQPAQNGQQPAQNGQQPQQQPAQNGQQPQQQPAQNGQQPQQQQAQNGQQPQQKNESKLVSSKKVSLNEARAAFVKLQAEYKKGDKRFFLSEGTIKPSKKEVAQVNGNLGGIESEKIEAPADLRPAINKIYEYAKRSVGTTKELIEMQTKCGISYFGIKDLLRRTSDKAIYTIDEKLYYGDFEDVEEILEDVQQGVAKISDLQSLDGKKSDYIGTHYLNECYDLIDTLLVENIKIKKAPLSSNGDVDESKRNHDILYGDKDRNDFEKKIERETKQAGVNNPLVPPQQTQESVEIDEEDNISESYINKENVEIIYEPMDWVIIKANGMKAQVTNVVNDGDGKLRMLTIVASNGICYDTDPDEIEPDPTYLANLPGSVVNSTLLSVPRLAQFDINPKTRLTDIVNNDDVVSDVKYKDFND